MEKQMKVESQLTSYLFTKAAEKRIPLCGTFELSPICNFDCKMCYVHLTQRDVDKTGKKLIDYKEWISIAKQAKEEGMLYLLLTGGEPFLYPNFRLLYESLADMGFVLSINSNGSLINEEVVNWLKRKAPSRINITLYGASNETYKKLTGYNYGFDKVSKAIDMLIDAGINVKLNCSLTPYNVNDLSKIIDFANKKHLMIEVASYMFPAVRISNENIGKNNRFTPEETAKYILKSFELQHGEKALIEYSKNVLRGITPCSIEECNDLEADGSVRCRAGKAMFWITWDGKVLPCGMMVSPAIDYKKSVFKHIWHELVMQTAKIRLSGQCSNCANKKICHVCAAMAYSETGVFEKTPTYLCEMVNALHEKSIEYLNNKSIKREEYDEKCNKKNY